MPNYLRFSSEEAGDVLVEVDAAEDLPVAMNVQAFLAAADALEKPPAEMEITFGLKATGEVGNLAVGKIAGESNYQVKMVWRCPADAGLASVSGEGAT